MSTFVPLTTPDLYAFQRRLEIAISDMMAAGHDSQKHWGRSFNSDYKEEVRLVELVRLWLSIEETHQKLGDVNHVKLKDLRGGP